ncbi:MAG: hypothetical protein A4S17_09600 [Proteobacteria bacterium HN_bin10]|jgi:uncharacterized protein YecT (DUF1311 family)|nr:MAG: hypothetical protein A4S17_09600 [Proteobacteria bacterium HN_bin10]
MPVRSANSRAGAVAVLLALIACNDAANGAKTEASSAERVAAALDVCGEDAGAFAQNVCGNRALAQLDNQVREALVAESASVSDAGAQLLVQNQNRWREAARVSCRIVDPDAAPTPEQQRCLENEFRARARDAQNTVQEIGGYTFQRMELVDAAPISAEIAANMGGADIDPIERDIRFPRIDGPQTPEIRRFNDLVAQQPQYALADAVNENVDYRIGFAGPELISVRFDSRYDGPTLANVAKTIRVITVLMTDGRPLTEADVFRADSGWRDFISARALAEIQRQLPDYPPPPRRDVYETATKPHLWLITERNLVLIFPPQSMTGWTYADPAEGVEVAIPWTELRAYLNPAAPAPIRPPV